MVSSSTCARDGRVEEIVQGHNPKMAPQVLQLPRKQLDGHVEFRG